MNPVLTFTKQALLFFGLAVVFVALVALGNLTYDGAVSMLEESEGGDYYCNVQGIELHGGLYTYIPSVEGEDPSVYESLYTDTVASESIVGQIRMAEEDESIKAILVEIDSSGGGPVAGEEVMRAMKESTKPVVALIREQGLSAAYLAATGADRIFASESSDVGSIGVTMSYLEEADPDGKYNQISSGKFKDAGNPSKPLTEEERQLFMRDVLILHENFVRMVSENRNLPIEKVKAIADGSSVLGATAKQLGLIDEIGGWTEAEKYLEGVIGEKAEVCW